MLVERSARPPFPVLGGRGAVGATVVWPVAGGTTWAGVPGVEGAAPGGGVAPATAIVVVGVLVTDGVGLEVAVRVGEAVGVGVRVGVGVGVD